ncbi:hypothetical protein ['Camptotheca acuminata' phytoplasma]|uniref:hypothetical protein n=1 Tax='Camptotheca acuminata' phytoplasma TaxID=3239192 RepID=UPI00351AA9BE
MEYVNIFSDENTILKVFDPSIINVTGVNIIKLPLDQKEIIFCIIENNYFYIIDYDPGHEAFKSKQKNEK